jgi:putative MATE family efflux protein
VNDPVGTAIKGYVGLLDRVGLVDARRSHRAVELAWPRMVTGLARISQRLVDFAMVGVVLGPAAIAGMAFAFAYWQIGNTLSLGLSGGTISQVSQRYGGNRLAEADLAIKQSVWASVVISLPVMGVLVAFPTELIGLLGQDSQAIRYGADYLQVSALAIGFDFVNKVASRALVGADDARTPMLIRVSGAIANAVFNAVFIFGLGLGVVGAALGTVVATMLITAAFSWGFVTGSCPGTGRFPVRVTLSGPYWDAAVTRDLFAVSVPLMGRQLAGTVVVLPLLAIVATFGPVVVAAFEVARQIRLLLYSPDWGFSLAASSLVGQSLGEGDPDEARSYGWDVLKLSTVSFVVLASFAFVFARPISGVFVNDPTTIEHTTDFVRVASVSAVGYGIDGAATGTLRGSGDTRWPFYGRVVGLYGFMLPVAYASIATPLGIVALYLALLVETAIPAFVSWYRFRSDAWIAVALDRGAAPMA